MSQNRTSPEVRKLLALSTLARLPLAMLSIGLLIHAARLTGSFAAAGAAVAAFAAAQSLGGPILGRWIDRHGQARLLAAAAGCSSTTLLVLAALPPGVPVAAVVALAGLTGAALPPVGACMRALMPGLVDRSAIDAAYVAEATASELAFVSGPPLTLLAVTMTSTAVALAATAGLLGLSTLGFAMQPAARAWRPAPRPHRDRSGALRSPAVRTLVAAFGLVGLLFGGVEVAVAATGGTAPTATVGALLGLWGVGSLVAGLVMTRIGGTPRHPARLVLVLAALSAGHLALAAVAGAPVALAGVLLVAGAAISPLYAMVNAMVEDAAPRGTTTEAFAWLATALGTGNAIGAALAGAVAERHGAALAFLLAGSAGLVATVLVAVRARCLTSAPADLERSRCGGARQVLAG